MILKGAVCIDIKEREHIKLIKMKKISEIFYLKIYLNVSGVLFIAVRLYFLIVNRSFCTFWEKLWMKRKPIECPSPT